MVRIHFPPATSQERTVAWPIASFCLDIQSSKALPLRPETAVNRRAIPRSRINVLHRRLRRPARRPAWPAAAAEQDARMPRPFSRVATLKAS